MTGRGLAAFARRPGGRPSGRRPVGAYGAMVAVALYALALVALSAGPASAQAPPGLVWEQLPIFQNRANQGILALDWLTGDGTADPSLDTLVIFQSPYGVFRYAPGEAGNGEWDPWRRLCISGCPTRDGLVTSEGSIIRVSRVYRSTNAGQTWELTLPDRGSPPLFEVTLPWMREASGGRSILLVGYDANDHAISYADGEAGSWRRTGPVTVFPESLAEVPPSPMLPNGRLLSGSGSLTMYSDDGSETWQVAALGNQPSESYRETEFAFLPKEGHPYGGVVFITTCENTDCDGGAETVDVYRSDDGGTSYTLVHEFTAAEVDLPFIDGVAIEEGYPFAGPDGALWCGVSNTGSAPKPGRIMRSTDEGVTWHRADAGLAEANGGNGYSIRKIVAHRDGRLYAATDQGVWRTVEPIATAAQANPPRPVLPELVVSPNPSSGSVTLAVSASEPAGTLVVTVFETTGRVVANVYTGPVAAGEHRYVVDTGGWAAGVYVAQVWVRGEAFTTRFTVTR